MSFVDKIQRKSLPIMLSSLIAIGCNNNKNEQPVAEQDITTCGVPTHEGQFQLPTGDNISSKLSQQYGEMTDQNGKQFNVMNEMRGKEYLLIQGYKGCQFCEKISNNLSNIRAQNPSIPIVVIDVMPEKDGVKPQEYTELYESQGIKEKNNKGERILFILFPKSREEVIDIQQDIGVRFNPSDEKSHGMRIMLVDETGRTKLNLLGTAVGEKSKKLADEFSKALEQNQSKENTRH